MASELHGPEPDLRVLFVAGDIFYVFSAAVHYIILAFEASHAAERRALDSQVAAREAELRALRAQLNPHFLFNSLNSINALVGTSPEEARRMCEGLGDFLRRTLKIGALDQVSLGEELSLVDLYLGIEQVRFGNRLQVERRIEPEALVENAVKHGVADRLEGGLIEISAGRHQGLLTIEVRNPVDGGAPPRRGSGVGLDNVRRRLRVLDATGGRLDVFQDNGAFRARLTLSAVTPDPAPARPEGPPA
jgi:LytS/YehU family sensor histidine kinase